MPEMPAMPTPIVIEFNLVWQDMLDMHPTWSAPPPAHLDPDRIRLRVFIRSDIQVFRLTVNEIGEATWVRVMPYGLNTESASFANEAVHEEFALQVALRRFAKLATAPVLGGETSFRYLDLDRGQDDAIDKARTALLSCARDVLTADDTQEFVMQLLRKAEDLDKLERASAQSAGFREIGHVKPTMGNP